MTRRVCSLLLGLCLAPAAAAQHRVVVQEAQVGRGPQVSADGKLAWVVAGVGEHVLQVIDLAGPTVLRQFYLPERIEFASVDRASRKVAVSTRSSTYLGSLSDDTLEEILPGVHGALLLQEEAALLAVLGDIPNPKKKERMDIFVRDERSLGVYDLNKKEWRFIQRTPIVSPYLASTDHTITWPALLFHDGAIHAGGVGGTLGSMIPITFSADARIDLKTGKARITTGPSSNRFRPDLKLPPALGKKEKDPREALIPDGYEGVELKHDEAYAAPALLVKANEAALASIKKLRDAEVVEKLQLGEGHVRDAQPMPFAVGPERVHMALRRYLRIVGAFGSHTAVLTLNKDGAIELGPTQNTSNNPFGRGLRTSFRLEYPEIDLRDLISGKPFLPEDVVKAKGVRDLTFIDEGVLVQDAERLAFFRPGVDKPVWSRKKLAERWDDVDLDEKRQNIAMLIYSQPILARILRLEDGEVVGNVPRPADVDDNYMTMDLSFDGKRLGVMYRRTLLLFDVASGKLLERNHCDEPYGSGLQAVSGGWLVSGESGSQIFDEATKKWRVRLAFPRAIHLQEIETIKGKRLLMQNYYGHCCLANPTDGTIIARWVASEYGQHRAPPWNAVFAGGQALLRPTGWIPTVELVDLRDDRVVLTIHSVPMGKSLGFIAFTPDGWWDATAGAERHVAVFEKGMRVNEDGRERRRNAKLIRERVAAVWK